MPGEKVSDSQDPFEGYFEGERLELLWRYAYPPEFTPLFQEYIGVKSGMEILDVGCGTGFLSRFLVKHIESTKVVGVEYDKKLIDIGEELIRREGLSEYVEIRQGDAYKLSFQDESFDMVTSQTLL